ncbi:hypothetical protein P154DRAFT_232153 [Amniculicola lignicola CBS 123094]|uniref:Uncharacterized protein n=1 Tax=Amniculicola lignicola CBS 123094 TaxID=1392246 RepID=A0A6A5WNQ3_9PLEO|nr:hypothetical protein P154DRAFT_232153 [Amniculicola lignicola CBS 123094]
MEEVPPYSPTAPPIQYLPSTTTPTEEDDAGLALAKTSSPTFGNRLDPLSFFEEQDNALRHAITTPIAFAGASKPPPDYNPIDDLARSFRLEGSFIYTTKTSHMPRYQLMQEFTRSGQPKRLSIRRLMPRESRSHSLPSSSGESERIRYDDEGTMYTIASYEMRGHRSSTLPGSIRLESGSSFLGGKWTKIYLWTKSARRDSLNPENEARILKYGYHSRDEWDKRLMFSIKKGLWENGAGQRIAKEEEGKDGNVFELLAGYGGAQRDLAVSCWVMKVWMGAGMRWQGDVKGW